MLYVELLKKLLIEPQTVRHFLLTIQRTFEKHFYKSLDKHIDLQI